MRWVTLAAVLLAGPAMAQDTSVLAFEGGGSTLALAPADIAAVQVAEDGDRWVLLLDIAEPAATDFGDLTEAAVGSEVVVNLCGARFIEVVAQARIEGGKLLLPMVSEEFAKGVERVLMGEATCESIRRKDQ